MAGKTNSSKGSAKNQSSMANPKNAESRKNLSTTFGTPKNMGGKKGGSKC